MKCKKCKKEIPDGSVFCNHCGKKQETAKRKARRRAKGTGTIRYDGRNKNNPYIVLSPSVASGVGKYYIGCYKTYTEAQKALEKYLSEGVPDLYNITLEKLYEQWNKNHFETLTRSGMQGYQSAYKSISVLYKRKMRDLKTIDFQNCIDKCAENYSRSKCEKVRQLCSQLCKYAMQNDIMDKNYAEFLKLPKAEVKEKTIFTNDELRILWEHTDDKRVQVILFMIYTGFRIGEVFTILKDNVHIEEGYIVGGEKTEAGRDRIVPLPSSIPEITQFVQSWYDESVGESLLDQTAEYFRKYEFYPVLYELGMIDAPIKSEKSGKLLFKNPRITPHCTRHTFATLSVNSGLSPENLQKIIGHASFETTADIYVHKDLQTLKSDMAKLEKFGA